MSRQSSYGDILRDAREKKHLDLANVSRRLRIRPDILQAIEDADFAKMPPRGYTRNMINAYSQLVGLNPHEITERYLDEVYRWESGSPSSQTTNSRSRSSSTASGRSSRGGQKRRIGTNRNNSSEQKTTRMQKLNSVESSQKVNNRTKRSQPQRNYGATNRKNYQKYYSAPENTRKITDIISPQLLLLIVLIVVIIILVIAIVTAFGSSRQDLEDVPDIPISGLTDTSDSSLEITGASAEDTEPTSATVVYEVASGDSSWIELYYDGSSSSDFEEKVDGPYTSEPISVTGTLLFKTANPAPVTLKVNDEEVELEYDGSEYYTYTVDFPAILAAWRADHGITTEEDTTDTEVQDAEDEDSSSYDYYDEDDDYGSSNYSSNTDNTGSSSYDNDYDYDYDDDDVDEDDYDSRNYSSYNDYEDEDD